MHLLQKSTWPRAPGGQKLQLVPYPIYRSRIAINIARSLNWWEKEHETDVFFMCFHEICIENISKVSEGSAIDVS